MNLQRVFNSLMIGLVILTVFIQPAAPVQAAQSTQETNTLVCRAVGVQYRGGHSESLVSGPSSLAVASDGTFWVVDTVGNRVLHYSASCRVLQLISLARNARGVIDIEVNSAGVWLLDTAATQPSVLLLNGSGKLILKQAVPEAVQNGLSGLASAPDGSLLLEKEGGAYTYRLADGGGMPTAEDFNPEELRNTAGDLPPVLTDEAGQANAATGQRLITDAADGTRLALTEQAELIDGVIVVDQTVRRYASDGTILEEARVPLADQHTYVTNPVAVGPDGQVYALITRPKSVEIHRLAFVNRLEPILPDPAGLQPGTEPESSLSDTGSVGAQAISIYPQTIINNAQAYLFNSRYLNSTVISGACTGRTKPRYLGGAGTYTSVPYDWGGFETVSGFNSAMSNNALRAGDADSTSTSCGRGVDCSGFVSRVWGLTTKYSTATLPNISSTLSALGQLRRGDILNQYDSHVVLFDAFAANGVWDYESTIYNTYDRVVYIFSSWSRLSGYTPRRFTGVGGDTCSGSYRAEYYNGKSLYPRSAATRCDSWPINFDWGSGSPASGVSSDNFSARWVGRANFTAGNYTFIATADDGVRVFLDQNLIIDAWKDQAPTEYRVTRFVSGGSHNIQVDYYENGGGAVARFRWEAAGSATPSPTPTPTPIPPQPPTSSGNLALNQPTYATSYEKAGYEPYRGNDGSTSTRWSSAISTTLGDQWWRVDMNGRSYNSVVIRWETAYAASHFVGWSDDGVNYTGYWYSISSPGAYRYNIGSHSNRYLAVLMRSRAPTMNNYSFYEYEVYQVTGTSALQESLLAEPDGVLETIRLPEVE